MNTNHLFRLFLLAAVFTLAACGGNGVNNPASSSNTISALTLTNPALVQSGRFVDAPVAGLTFVSGAQSGTTDAAGTFMFEAGGTVQFKVGNVVLGQAPGKAIMTPLDLVRAVDPAAVASDARVVQIVQFLMTLNASPSVAAISIPAVSATAAMGEAPVDLSMAPVDVAAILGRLVPAKAMVAAADAAAHIQATLAGLTAPKTGTFAALDSMASPTLGLSFKVTPNLVGNAFDVTGIAANLKGDTWTIAGTLTLDGSLQAAASGTGTAPPAAMTITGAMSSATQITATASFTLNLLPQQVALTFEKGVAPAVTGKFALPADPGVTNAGQNQHIAADLTIMADGSIAAHLLEAEISGLPLCPQLGGRVAGLAGVVTSVGNLIAVGGTPGTGETTVSRSSTPPTSVVLLTGSVTAAGTVSAKVAAADITGGGLTIPPLGFVKATNPLVGVFKGTHSDDAPNPPGTVAVGVNNDGSVHGFTRFINGKVGARFPENDYLLDGVVDAAGVLGVPPDFAVKNLGAIAGNPGVPGLVMTDDEGTNFGAFVGTFGGTIDPAAGSVTGGAFTTGPCIASGTFMASLLM
jgi:hypothetical protein